MKNTMQEVRTFRIQLYCHCGGLMRWNQTSLTVNPPIYPHTCEKCGSPSQEKQAYPYDVQVDVGEEQDILPE